MDYLDAPPRVISTDVQNAARSLQNHSELYVAAITRASLQTVSFVYEKNPHMLTDVLVHDAIVLGARPEVICFFIAKLPSSGDNVSEWIGEAFNAAALVSSNPQQTALLWELIETFPNNLIASSPRVSFCPLWIALCSTAIPQVLVDEMIKKIRGNQHFALRGDNNVPIEHVFTPGVMYKPFNDHRMRSIAAILTKVKRFGCHWLHWKRTEDADQMAELMSFLFRDTVTVTEMQLDFWPGSAPLENFLNTKQLESLGTCHIIDFSLSFWGPDNLQPDFSILCYLQHMLHIQRLHFFVQCAWKVDDYFSQAVCQLLGRSLTELSVIGKTKATGVFRKVVDAIKDCSTLVYVKLENLQDHAETKSCRKAMLAILEANTQLEVALINNDWVTEASSPRDWAELKREQFNMEWLPPQMQQARQEQQRSLQEDVEGRKHQARIDFFTVLNMSRCNKARDKKHTSLRGFLQLVSLETLEGKFLHMTGEPVKPGFVMNMQYGLLCEAPTIWLPDAPSSSLPPKRKRAMA